jgi:hypothetical protein
LCYNKKCLSHVVYMLGLIIFSVVFFLQLIYIETTIRENENVTIGTKHAKEEHVWSMLEGGIYYVRNHRCWIQYGTHEYL